MARKETERAGTEAWSDIMTYIAEYNPAALAAWIADVRAKAKPLVLPPLLNTGEATRGFWSSGCR